MPTKINQDNLKKVSAALSNAGLSGNTLVLALAQVAHETAGFNNAKITTHNNASGIVFANNPKKQPNASRGNKLPEAPKYNYAKFDSLNDWAKDYIRIVGNNLKKSADSSQYALRLADQKYYEVSPRYPNAIKNYSAGLANWFDKLQKISPTTKATTVGILPLAIVAISLYLIFK
jgi:hypothetical protein